jgi:hypothetical protein
LIVAFLDFLLIHLFLSCRKLPTTPLFKRILALRVQLSTAPVSTIDEFLELGGLEAIETLLGRIVRLNDAGKGEVGDTVLLETVRVVRVISNTEVSKQHALPVGLLIVDPEASPLPITSR